MRKEPFTVGSFVHVIKRGSRGLPIVRDETDRWRFVLMLRHFNDEKVSENWFRDLMSANLGNTLQRAPDWPEQKKLVHIHCFCLLNNHFHLLLEEIRENGISKFMHGIGTGMAKHFNGKYHESGSLFQGAYRARTVKRENYFRYVTAYIQVKNAFELYRGGLRSAAEHFEDAYRWASRYPYCSLGEYTGERDSPVVDGAVLRDLFSPNEYKKFSRDFMSGCTIEQQNRVMFE